MKRRERARPSVYIIDYTACRGSASQPKTFVHHEAADVNQNPHLIGVVRPISAVDYERSGLIASFRTIDVEIDGVGRARPLYVCVVSHPALM